MADLPIIQFGVSKDGEPQLLIAEGLWSILKKAVAGQEEKVTTDGYVRVSLAQGTDVEPFGVTGVAKSFTIVMSSDEPPCKPFGGT